MTLQFFPPDDQWPSDGLIAVGGDLSPALLLDAYRHGIFPWPSDEEGPLPWFSPDPRAILPLDGFRISRRLRRTLRSRKFEVTSDQTFEAVLAGCAKGTGREGGTWITDEMQTAYAAMHRLEHTHCVETWHDGKLAGGIYGIAIGGLFSAESMFYRVRDASKVALAHLVRHLNQRGYTMLDIQQWTPHTGRLGAIEITRDDYLSRVATAIELPVTFGAISGNEWPEDSIANL